MALRAILIKKISSSFNTSSLGFIEKTQTIRRNFTDLRCYFPFRETTRRFNSEKEEEDFNIMKWNLYSETRVSPDAYSDEIDPIDLHELRREMNQHKPPRRQRKKINKELRLMRRRLMKIEDKRLEEEVEERRYIR